MQGNPFDHSFNLFTTLQNIKNKPFQWVSERMVRTCLYRENKRHQCKNIKNSYETIFEKEYTNLGITFGAGAQFIVSREQILKRPVSFYERIVKLLEYDIDPPEGHDVERFHHLIFQ